MKDLPLYDILFILLSAIILIALNYFSNPEYMGKYSLVIAMASYFIGKAVRKYEVKKKAGNSK